MQSRIIEITDTNLISVINNNTISQNEEIFASFIHKDNDTSSMLLPVYDMEGVESYPLIYLCKEIDTLYGNLDGLFIDKYSIPTLLEVKRASDARTRREVMTQILDYGNGITRMHFDELCKRIFCKSTGRPEEEYNKNDKEDMIRSWVKHFYNRDDKITCEAFEKHFRLNLMNGYVRLCVASERIDQSLIDLASYVSTGSSSFRIGLFELSIVNISDKFYFVPHLKYSTSRFPHEAYSIDIMIQGTRSRLSMEQFYSILSERTSPDIVRDVKNIISKIINDSQSFFFSEPREGSCSLRFKHKKSSHTLLNMYVNGNVVPGWISLEKKPESFKSSYFRLIKDSATLFDLDAKPDNSFWADGNHTTIPVVSNKIDDFSKIAISFANEIKNA